MARRNGGHGIAARWHEQNPRQAEFRALAKFDPGGQPCRSRQTRSCPVCHGHVLTWTETGDFEKVVDLGAQRVLSGLPITKEKALLP
jgi:hypothetical protein